MASTDVVYRIIEEEEEAALEVVKSYNGDWVLLSTASSARSKAYFGEIELNISKEFANQLGKALIEASK